MTSQFIPRDTAVTRSIEASSRPGGRRIDTPCRAARVPERSIDGPRIVRIGSKFDRTHVFVLVEHSCPRLSAISRAKHSAFLVWSKAVTERGHQDNIGVFRIYEDAANLARVSQSEMRPGFAGIA